MLNRFKLTEEQLCQKIKKLINTEFKKYKKAKAKKYGFSILLLPAVQLFESHLYYMNASKRYANAFINIYVIYMCIISFTQKHMPYTLFHSLLFFTQFTREIVID